MWDSITRLAAEMLFNKRKKQEENCRKVNIIVTLIKIIRKLKGRNIKTFQVH